MTLWVYQASANKPRLNQCFSHEGVGPQSWSYADFGNYWLATCPRPFVALGDPLPAEAATTSTAGQPEIGEAGLVDPAV
eukprot:m.13608 g.13608  ORF g.13608 m.13608 type:complete len:79 (+) comp7529_c0_seq1:1-237(+)